MSKRGRVDHATRAGRPLPPCPSRKRTRTRARAAARRHRLRVSSAHDLKSGHGTSRHHRSHISAVSSAHNLESRRPHATQAATVRISVALPSRWKPIGPLEAARGSRAALGHSALAMRRRVDGRPTPEAELAGATAAAAAGVAARRDGRRFGIIDARAARVRFATGVAGACAWAVLLRS